MNLQRRASWIAFTAVPLIVALVLSWLLLGYAGGRRSAHPLPGATGFTVEHLHDRREALTLSEVESVQDDWTSWTGGGFSVTGHTRVLWVRVRLHNARDIAVQGALENDDYFADRLEAWIKEPDAPPGAYSSHELFGEGVPASVKKVKGREAVVLVTLPPLSSRVVYLRIEDCFNPFVRLVWWPDATDFHEARFRSGLAEGVYLGGLLALLGYNLLLCLRLRQRDMGWYVAYLGTAAMFITLARACWPAWGVALASPALETALTLTMVLSSYSLTRFAREFLELKAGFPRCDQWLRCWGAVMLVVAFGCLSTWWHREWRWLPVATIITGLTHLGLLSVALLAWRARLWQARFFVISFGCLFAGSLPVVAVWFWETLLRDVAMRGLMIGSALEMLLLSLAVADRFSRAQEQLVEETEQRRMIEETYADELEEEVRERTRELQAANADKDRMLAVIGHDLRGPLTGLMRSAESGTEDLPRDTARTSRALLLMIEDLVLWARLRAGRSALAAHPAQALLAPAVALHRSLAEQGEVALVQEGPEGLWVETDPVLAQTLIRNLLANALKFARARAVLRLEERTDGVRFIIGNDGPALSQEVAARLAEDRDEPVTATSGMGLRLCREICRVLGLKLVAGAGAEGGTEFSFTLRKAAPAVKTERET